MSFDPVDGEYRRRKKEDASIDASGRWEKRYPGKPTYLPSKRESQHDFDQRHAEKMFDTVKIRKEGPGNLEHSLFMNLMSSDTQDSWFMNWERVEDNLYDKGTEDNRMNVCHGCGENRPTSNKAASLGIDIMGTRLCKKCSNEGYLARF